MRTFNFKLTALLKLKEAQREQALVQFASSIKEVQKLEKKLAISQNKLDSVLSILHDRKKGTFRSDQIEALHSSLMVEREKLSKNKISLNQAKEMQVSRRKIFLEKDSQYKSIQQLQEKQKEDHYFNENKKEQLELEDIIGSRFLFQRINENV